MATCLLAWRIAYYGMSNWLDNFAYRTEIGRGVFLWFGCVTLLIALVTVSYQALKAARSNPVVALKYE